jgi:hypothetical protein
MLGYISSTRKKSCYVCVKSKRRCDLGYPFCKRCFVKGTDCIYPGAKARKTVKDVGVVHVPVEVVIRQTTPDLTTPPGLEFEVDDSETNIDPFILQWSSSSSSPESFEYVPIQENWGIEIPPLTPLLTIPRMLSPEIEAPSYLSTEQIRFLVRSLRSVIPSLAYTGSTLFIHKTLYRTYQLPAYQDSVAISALYLARTPETQHILASTISAKIANLSDESSTWTLPQHLAAVQALLMYQIIRLFDPSAALQSSAVKHNPLLELWAAHLWKRSFASPYLNTPYLSWIFAESLRRTVMLSVFVRCCWSCVTRGGLADQVHVLARLPVWRGAGAWESEEAEWASRRGGCGLTSYEELAGSWNKERNVGGLDRLERLLVAACRGREDPRLLV